MVVGMKSWTLVDGDGQAVIAERFATVEEAHMAANDGRGPRRVNGKPLLVGRNVWSAQVGFARRNGIREELIDLLRAKGEGTIQRHRHGLRRPCRTSGRAAGRPHLAAAARRTCARQGRHPGHRRRRGDVAA